MIEYDPQDAVMCWPAGDYAAALKSAEETTSKAGNPMYVLTFEVFDNERGSVQVKDYAVIPTMLWRVKRFAQAIGEEAAFLSGTFDPSKHVGDGCVVELEIEQQEGFDDRNRIKAYKPKDQTRRSESQHSKPPEESPLDF